MEQARPSQFGAACARARRDDLPLRRTCRGHAGIVTLPFRAEDGRPPEDVDDMSKHAVTFYFGLPSERGAMGLLNLQSVSGAIAASGQAQTFYDGSVPLIYLRLANPSDASESIWFSDAGRAGRRQRQPERRAPTGLDHGLGAGSVPGRVDHGGNRGARVPRRDGIAAARDNGI